MKITLDLLRSALRRGLGRDSFIASFVNSIHESNDCSTASITSDGVLRYNPEFTSKYVTSERDLFSLVLHEIMHPMFGHFIYDSGKLENIAADCVINASISILFADASGEGYLFRKFYKPTGLDGLLRIGSRMSDSRYSRLYNVFYGGLDKAHWLTTGEVIQTLKVLTPPEDANAVTLLGSHTENNAANAVRNGTQNASGVMSSDTLSRIADDLKKKAKLPKGSNHGFGENLYDVFTAVIKSHLTLKRTLLERWLTRKKLDGFRSPEKRPRIQVSPIPLRPSKRDLVLLSAGFTPFQYHQTATGIEIKKRGLAVYLDVSGSVNTHLPKIIGLLSGLKDDLTSIFLFSNAVVETSFKAVVAGVVRTTLGTDFDCIAQSILEKDFEKAIIVTDGYGKLLPENRIELMKKRVKILTVLFGGKLDCPEFEPLGDVMQLNEVTE